MFKSPITRAKRKIARATGIPTSRSGRRRKANKLGGQSLFWLVAIVLVLIYL